MSKWYCWSELEGCQASKKSDLVLEDLDVQGFRSSVHTNSQYFLAWMSPCMVTFAKRWVLNISRQRTFVQKKFAHFLTILPPVSIGCAATELFLGVDTTKDA